MADTPLPPPTLPYPKVADKIPARIRAGIYVTLAAVQALEQIWDLLPAPLEGKVLASLTALGLFGAALHTPIRNTPPA